MTTASAHPAERRTEAEPTTIDDLVARAAIAVGPHGDGARTLADWLDAGLAVARGVDGLTFVALPAPVTDVAPIIAALAEAGALRDDALVAWTAPGLTLVGAGVARQLRGAGASRWAEVIAGAHAITTNTADVCDEPRDTMPTPLPADVPARAVIAGVPATLAALGFARPRFVGGAAFAPGAADVAPWSGFGDAWFALPRWTYVHDGVRAFVVLAVDAADAADAARWHAELATLGAALAPERPALERRQPALVEVAPADPHRWRAQVTAITDAIARGELSKVVAARTCSVALAGDVRAAELLAALDARHADCVRVMIRPPGAGTLIAATPERLVRKLGDVVECDALAGSIARPGDANGDDARAAATLLASTKDRVEHQLVVDAIRAALTAAGAEIVEPRDEDRPPVVRALRHVIHLHTPFRAVLRRPRHVLELAARLHPTPAVGGTPTALAQDWILAREPVARGWYASPVGWFDLEGDGELAVALRSGVVEGRHAHLWAGAGIVAGSDPDRELAETRVKLRAMLGALGAGDPGQEDPA